MQRRNATTPTTFKDHLRINADDAHHPFDSPASAGDRSTMDPRMTASWSAASTEPHTRRPRSAAAAMAATFRPQARQSLSFSNAGSDASLATTTLDGPHDFYAHPSYQNMMDDRQLIDSCTEAQREIDAPVDTHCTAGNAADFLAAATSSSRGNATTTGSSSTASASFVGGPQNAQRLRQWIGYMRKYLEAMSPSRAEVLRMGTFERRVRLGEQAELRQYIASYDRTVKRTAASNGGGDEDGLEAAYLALLLQAIEAQCLLEGYPGMRRTAQSTAGRHNDENDGGRNDDDDDDDASNETNSDENTVEEFVVRSEVDTDGDGDIMETDAPAIAALLGVRYVEGRENDDEVNNGPTSAAVDVGVQQDGDDDVSEDAVSSVFVAEFDGEHRPRTSLRDELLAMATTAVADNGADVLDGVEETPLQTNDLCGRHDPDADNTTTKLTKDMVNRWLQLNLQPITMTTTTTSSVTAAERVRRPQQRLTIVQQQQRRTPTPPPPCDGAVERETNGLADPCDVDNNDDGNPDPGDKPTADIHSSMHSRSSSSCHSSTGSHTVSPADSDEPIWDGFVHQYQHRKTVLVRLVTALMAKSDDDCDDSSDCCSFNVEMVERAPETETDGIDDRVTGASSPVVPATTTPVVHDDVQSVPSSVASLSDSSFLLSSQPRRLTMSTLKSIDDIFAVQHATPHRVEWVTRRDRNDPTPSTKHYNSPEDARDFESERRSPSGRSQSPVSAKQAVVAPPSALRIAEAIAQLEQSLRQPLPAVVVVPEGRTKEPDYKPNDNKNDRPQASKSRRRRRKTGGHKKHKETATAAQPQPRPPPPMADLFANCTLPELLENNLAAMQPSEVRAIVKLCQAHLDCLNHVMLSRTVNAICGQPAMDSTRCELSLEIRDADGVCPTGVCRCGPIARFVQSMVTFVRDYMNAIRHWRLYRVVMAAIGELYGMVKFVGERVRWHRAQMVTETSAKGAAATATAIEFVL